MNKVRKQEEYEQDNPTIIYVEGELYRGTSQRFKGNNLTCTVFTCEKKLKLTDNIILCSSITTIKIFGANLKKIHALPKYAKVVDISGCTVLTGIETPLPETVIELNCNGCISLYYIINTLAELKQLHMRETTFDIRYWNFNSLEVLDCSNSFRNKLTPNIIQSPTLFSLYIQNNYIKKITKLPINLRFLTVDYTTIIDTVKPEYITYA